MPKVGDEIILLQPFWYFNENLGDRLGKVVAIDSYIMVDIYQYHSNPVKCFRDEINVLSDRVSKDNMPDEDELEEYFNP